jgi:hypothetical protein
LKGLQAEMLAKYRVPVSFSLCDLVRARSGEHRLPVGMVKHLAWAAARDGVFGQNPLPDILVRDSPAARRDAARQYVKYAEAAVNGHQPDAYNMSVLHAAQPTELSCALDTPFHAVRRLLEHLFPRSTAAGLSKTELLASVEESELVAIHQCLRTILGFLKIYQNLLAQESLPTAKAYETFLRSWEPRLICNARRCLSAVTRSI